MKKPNKLLKNLEKFLEILYFALDALASLCWAGKEILRVWREGKPDDEEPEKRKRKS